MKKNFLWLLLFVPAIFIAASSPLANDNDLGDNESRDCSSSGDEYSLYNGDQGCPYNYDFSSYVSCDLDSLDLDNTTTKIDHYINKTSHEAWYTTSGGIQMVPKEGYGGPGFLVTLNIRTHYNGSSEVEWWNCHVTTSSPPYPDPCY